MAKRHIGSQTARYGYPAPNMGFRRGYIEDLAAAGIANDSVDLVISNCVINLSLQKERVFREIFRVLKPGAASPKRCATPRFAGGMPGRRIDLRNPVLEEKFGMVDFYSITMRAFKLELEDICEDYGQTATTSEQ